MKLSENLKIEILNFKEAKTAVKKLLFFTVVQIKNAKVWWKFNKVQDHPSKKQNEYCDEKTWSKQDCGTLSVFEALKISRIKTCEKSCFRGKVVID